MRCKSSKADELADYQQSHHPRESNDGTACAFLGFIRRHPHLFAPSLSISASTCTLLLPASSVDQTFHDHPPSDSHVGIPGKPSVPAARASLRVKPGTRPTLTSHLSPTSSRQPLPFCQRRHTSQQPWLRQLPPTNRLSKCRSGREVGRHNCGCC